MKRRLACALVVVALAGVLAGAAAAHPRLAGTAPAAGARLDQRTAHGRDQAVGALGARRRRDLGHRVPTAARSPTARSIVGPSSLTRAIDARQHGSYVVEWLAVGSDSHPARGAFFFSVGEPTRAVLPGPARAGRTLEVLGRWLSLLGFALGFGVPFAALLSGGMTARLWRLVSAGVVLMIVAEPVALLGQTALLAPSRMFEPQLIEDVLLTSYGHLAGLRLGAAVGLWALAGAVRRLDATRAVVDPCRRCRRRDHRGGERAPVRRPAVDDRRAARRRPRCGVRGVDRLHRRRAWRSRARGPSRTRLRSRRSPSS